MFDATTDLVNGQTPIQGIISSPIFQNYNFNDTNVKVGNTQFGDARRRANFWDSVSKKSPDYHVLLGQPTVAPIVTINVPTGSFDYYDDPVTGLQPLVSDEILNDLIGLALTSTDVSPQTLPIIVWGQVSGPTTGGFHGVISGNGPALQTFIGVTYGPGVFFQFPDLNLSGIFFEDTYPLSHEIAEWMDDPFINNFTPGWDIAYLFPGQPAPDSRCDSFSIAGDRLEVADPVELFVQSDVPLPSQTCTYHVTESVFIDWFTRAARSRSYNGQYSMFEISRTLPGLDKATPPTAVCTGHVEFAPVYVDFPGAVFTAVNGINIGDTAVGEYFDGAGQEHGFLFDGSKYSTLDYPGALATSAQKITAARMIVGSFLDAAGATHGFSYFKGQWTQIDFPGAADTEVYGVNSGGAIVGNYNVSQPVAHAFLLQTRKYQDVANPFGTQTNAFALNDSGSIAGLGYTDPSAGPFTSFVLSKKGFSTFQFPDSVFSQLNSINNGGDLAGYFADPDGSFWGMVTVGGLPYQLYAIVLGNNDLQDICGYLSDLNGQEHGFIGKLPFQRNIH